MSEIGETSNLDNWLERKFQLKEHSTNVKTEIMAGTALFLATAAMPAIHQLY